MPIIMLALGVFLLSAMWKQHENAHNAEKWAADQHNYDREFSGIEKTFYRETA